MNGNADGKITASIEFAMYSIFDLPKNSKILCKSIGIGNAFISICVNSLILITFWFVNGFLLEEADGWLLERSDWG